MTNEEIYRKYADDLVRFATGLVGPFDAPNVAARCGAASVKCGRRQLRTLPVAPDVAVNLPTAAFGSVSNVTVTVGEWLGQFRDDGTPWDVESDDEPPEFYEPHFGYFGAGDRSFAYWPTLDADGTIVQITGQYRP